MNNSPQIKEILKDAINIQRWVPKSNLTYSFLEEDEIEEMVKNILQELDSKYPIPQRPNGGTSYTFPSNSDNLLTIKFPF